MTAIDTLARKLCADAGESPDEVVSHALLADLTASEAKPIVDGYLETRGFVPDVPASSPRWKLYRAQAETYASA